MANSESLDEVITKRLSKSLLCFMKLVDPERKFVFDPHLVEAWNRLTLNDQRKLYLYILYRKWRGLDVYGEPYAIIKNCHPVPFNWNGQHGINTLIKERKIVIAKYRGEFGSYTADEAMLYEMTNVKQLI